MEMKLTCTGILEAKDDLRLKLDPGSARRCDASLDGWKWQAANSEIARHVRTACAEGMRCRISGTVTGRGVSYWVKITSVQGLDNPDQSAALGAAMVLAAALTMTLREGRPQKIYAAG